MINSDQRMIETQARKISELNDRIRSKDVEIYNLKDKMYRARKISELNDRIRSKDVEIYNLKDKMYREHLAGKFYLEMQKAIMDNPALKSEWDNFCIVLRMVCPEMDEILTTVTEEHEQSYSSSNFYS